MATVRFDRDVSKLTIREEDNNIYFNVDIVNSTTSYINANIKLFKSQSFIEDASQYEMTVARFSIPVLNIPIQSRFQQDKYIVRLEYDGAIVSNFVNIDINPIVGYGSLFTYSEIINGINKAYALCFTQLKLLKPLSPQTAPPQFVLNYENGLLMAVYAPTNYDYLAPIPMKILINKLLFYIFPTLSVYPDTMNSGDFGIKVYDQLTNTKTINAINYFVMSETNSTISLLNELQSINFQSNMLPINPEYSSNASNITSQIITDFEALKGLNDKTYIQYYPQGPFRWIDLKSNTSIKDIDISVYWKDIYGYESLLQIPPSSTLTLKILFRKKNKDSTFGYS